MNNKSNSVYRKSKLACAMLIASTSTSVLAQSETPTNTIGELEEIVVTAQYREQSLQDVPIAISAFSAQDLESAGVNDLKDLYKLAPDFTASSDVGPTRLSLRGIQSNSTDETTDQALVFNIDGDYINRPDFIDSAMFDVERVELLRGPQGTLYGRNATGGAINVIARRPTFDGVHGDFDVDLGNYSSEVLNAAVNVSLSDTAAIRVAGISAKHDGYSSHSNVDYDTNDKNRQAARIGFLYEPTEDFSLYLAAEQSKSDFSASIATISANSPGNEADGPAPGTGTCSGEGWAEVVDPTIVGGVACAPYNTNNLSDVDPDNYNYAGVMPGLREPESKAIRGQVSYDFDSVSLSYRFAERRSEMVAADPLPGLVFYRDLEVDNSSHEFRVTGGNDDGLFWQTGLFYFNESLDMSGGLHLPFGGAADPMGAGIWINTFYRPDFESESKAAFGQVELPFSDVLTAVLGVRYTKDDKSGTYINFVGPPAFTAGGFENIRPIEAANQSIAQSVSENKTTWTAGVNYEPSEDSLHYAKVSKGYKAGGFDSVGPFGSEEVISYEIGSKNKIGQQTINANAYFYDYKDLQAQVVLDASIGGQVFNAGKAEVWGIELQYDTVVGKSGLLGLSATYTNAEFIDFAPLQQSIQCVGGCGNNTAVADASGNDMPNAPDLIFTVSYDHVWSTDIGDFTGRIYSLYKSEYHTTFFNYNDDLQESYTQTDVSLEWVSENSSWSILGYVRNLEDERPINNFRFVSAGGANDDFNWAFGTPRTYGLKIGYQF